MSPHDSMVLGPEARASRQKRRLEERKFHKARRAEAAKADVAMRRTANHLRRRGAKLTSGGYVLPEEGGAA